MIIAVVFFLRSCFKCRPSNFWILIATLSPSHKFKDKNCECVLSQYALNFYAHTTSRPPLHCNRRIPRRLDPSCSTLTRFHLQITHTTYSLFFIGAPLYRCLKTYVSLLCSNIQHRPPQPFSFLGDPCSQTLRQSYLELHWDSA